MWQIKKFKTELAMNTWIMSNKKDYQINIIYINNAYGLEYKELLTIFH